VAHTYQISSSKRQQLHASLHQISLDKVEVVMTKNAPDFFARAKELADQTWARRGEWEPMELVMDNHDVWVLHNACFAASRPLLDTADWAREVYQPPASLKSLPESQSGGEHPYGTGWAEARSRSLESANFECEECGMSQEEHRDNWSVGLHVHHIKRVRSFEQYSDAHSVENLETLCVKCHNNRHK